MVGFTANKIEAVLHKCNTQLSMSQTVTHIWKTKYSSLVGCGAEQFPVFQKCYIPVKQWKLLIQWYRIHIMLACKHFSWSVLYMFDTYTSYPHTDQLIKLKSWCSDANIINRGRLNNFIHSCSFTRGYCNNLFCNAHFTIYQW